MAPTHTLRVNDLFTQPQKSPRKCSGFDAHHSLMPTISLVEAELFPGACCVLAIDYTRSALGAGVFDEMLDPSRRIYTSLKAVDLNDMVPSSFGWRKKVW